MSSTITYNDFIKNVLAKSLIGQSVGVIKVRQETTTCRMINHFYHKVARHGSRNIVFLCGIQLCVDGITSKFDLWSVPINNDEQQVAQLFAIDKMNDTCHVMPL